MPRSAGDLANGDAEHPANDFEQTSNGKRDGQSDQQDHERNRQRDARCSSEGDQPLKKRPSSARWPGDVNDVAEPVTSLARIGERCLSRCAVCQVAVEIQAGDTRIPRGRIARGKRIRKDVIDRALGRETVSSIPEFVNTADRSRRRPARSPRGYCPDIRWCFLCKARFLLTRPSGACHAQPGLDDAASLASRSTRPAVLPLWLSAASPGRTLSLPTSTTPP